MKKISFLLGCVLLCAGIVQAAEKPLFQLGRGAERENQKGRIEWDGWGEVRDEEDDEKTKLDIRLLPAACRYCASR